MDKTYCNDPSLQKVDWKQNNSHNTKEIKQEYCNDPSLQKVD